MPKFLINFATRSRPDKFFNCMDNIIGLLSNENDFQIIVTADIDDKTMCNDEVRDKVAAYPNTKIFYGLSKNKIDAINKNVPLADGDWDILINQSDDMFWLQNGFDKIIADHMNKYFPDFDGFLHYHDMSPASDVLCTLSILGRKYYERTNYIYHPDYANVYCDQEATDVAKKLGKHKYFNINLFEHRHPVWKKAEMDEQYVKTENRDGYAADHAIYQMRKKKNFYL